jgi:hypothetical protein
MAMYSLLHAGSEIKPMKMVPIFRCISIICCVVLQSPFGSGISAFAKKKFPFFQALVDAGGHLDMAKYNGETVFSILN